MTANDKGLLTNRRNMLLGVGMAGGVLAAGLSAARAATGKPEEQVTDAPVSDNTQQRQPFFGVHQAGVITPRSAAGMIASFDVLATTPVEVERLFRTLSARIAFLMQGGEPPAFDDKLPPSDSGILGPVVPPDNLTMTISLG